LTETIDELDTMEALRQERQRLRDENQALKRALKAAERRPAVTALEQGHVAERSSGPITSRTGSAAPSLDRLHEGGMPPRRVACVGGRTAQLPAYREVVEAHGLELLHHDGGEEDNLGQLPATLAAADLVICQVGCISHNAYWRVKDHCKRNSKPCVFLESSSRSALERTMTRIIGEWPTTPT